MIGAGTLTTDTVPDLLVMILVAILAGTLAWTGDRLRRLEGALLFSAYPVANFLAL